MNLFPAPAIDDDEAFRVLSEDVRLGSFPHLRTILPVAIGSYAQYRASNGNPFVVTNPAVGEEEGNFLRGHFGSPPACLAYIAQWRESSRHLVCPMCGSGGCGTLDHFFPKETHPIFSIFSLNLVPACSCNVRRKKTLVGANAGERLLHPFFDACLSERLFAATFEDPSLTPRIGVTLTINNAHPQFDAISFHFQTIVEKTCILAHFIRQWGWLCRKPSVVVRAFARNITNQDELLQILLDEQQSNDELHEGKNNWQSAFISGLLEPELRDWLIAQFSRAGRQPNSPFL